MKTIALSEIKDNLSKYLRMAEKEQIIIMRHGKPAGVLVGFKTEDDWRVSTYQNCGNESILTH